MVNDHTAFRVDWMPFAGLKQSGLGTGGIAHTMEALQIKKLRPQLTEPASLARAAWHPRPRFSTKLSYLRSVLDPALGMASSPTFAAKRHTNRGWLKPGASGVSTFLLNF
jgi:hypothetical protein